MATDVIRPEEVKILFYLMDNGPSRADTISVAIGLRKSETYNLISSLISMGIIFSTGERPQRYRVLCREEVADFINQSRSDFLEMLENEKSKCMSMLADLLKKKAAVGS